MKLSAMKPLALAMGLALGLAGCATQTPSKGAAKMAAAAVPAAPKVFDVSELGDPASACTDFNTFVNAKWVAANPIPADRVRWGAFDALQEKSLDTQHAIVEDAAKNAAGAQAGSIEQKIGWFYAAGMDEAAVNKAGFDPIKPELAKIDALKSRKDVVAYLNDSFARGQGGLFQFGSGADFKNSSMQIAYAYQGGLGLPTKDYYLKKDYAKLRTQYVAHIAKMLELAGTPAADAAKQAKAVMAFETRLAKASLAPVELRKPENQYHFVSFARADKLTPGFSWQQFFAAQGLDVKDGFSLSQPAFFGEVGKLLKTAPASQWRAYLRYHAIEGAAPYLSDPFVQENFAFYSQTLQGQKEIKPRWKRVLGATNEGMGMALGELYVAKTFPPEAKQQALVLVNNLRDALKARIEKLDWMGDATKQKALEKWSTFLPKIGYPDKWRDWSGLTVTPDNYYANAMAAARFNHDYDLSKVGKPTDRLEWGMTPQTVNAYYNPTDNTVNFPAAILQPPFFDPHADDAINYGGIGAVIGHEMTHGYDDEGSQFDAKGNNANWWTKDDRAKFDARTHRLVEQFNGYAPLADKPDLHVNGQLTLGENIADLGGLNVAHDALQMALANKPQEAAEKIDGYTQDQRFFLNWARVWRGDIREQAQIVRLNADPHAPAKFRAIGAPSNMPAFAEAFQCKAGQPMVRPDDTQVKIW
ncbi:MAG: M13 family metallopeptidase [Mizugakiibacter sp.]|uniref:M13 family metallopeptidase n=1 Tax=Mizugakiibacter sp. TaxID=1972610 RepID=UPI0031C5330B|nr:M13 family metallopeptidase [Xanthomonadaceae bacterium]